MVQTQSNELANSKFSFNFSGWFNRIMSSIASGFNYCITSVSAFFSSCITSVGAYLGSFSFMSKAKQTAPIVETIQEPVIDTIVKENMQANGVTVNVEDVVDIVDVVNGKKEDDEAERRLTKYLGDELREEGGELELTEEGKRSRAVVYCIFYSDFNKNMFFTQANQSSAHEKVLPIVSYKAANNGFHGVGSMENSIGISLFRGQTVSGMTRFYPLTFMQVYSYFAQNLSNSIKSWQSSAQQHDLIEDSRVSMIA